MFSLFISADIEVIVCDKLERVQLILSQASSLRTLKHLIVYDDIPESYKQKAAHSGIRVQTFEQILDTGFEQPFQSCVSCAQLPLWVESNKFVFIRNRNPSRKRWP